MVFEILNRLKAGESLATETRKRRRTEVKREDTLDTSSLASGESTAKATPKTRGGAAKQAPNSNKATGSGKGKRPPKHKVIDSDTMDENSQGEDEVKVNGMLEVCLRAFLE